MSIGERIKKIRSDKKLTQQKFAESIHLKRNTVGNYEIDLIEPSDRAIADICRVFDVNERWLRTGEGDVYSKRTASEELEALAKRYDLRPRDYILIEHLVKLSPEERDGIFRFMQDVVDGARGCGADPDAPAVPGGAVSLQEMSPEQLHAELDRQLSDQEGQMGGSSASGRSS